MSDMMIRYAGPAAPKAKDIANETMMMRYAGPQMPEPKPNKYERVPEQDMVQFNKGIAANDKPKADPKDTMVMRYAGPQKPNA